jgi:hypothetical protein
MNKPVAVTTSRGRQPIFTPPGGATGLNSGSVPSAQGQRAVTTSNVRQAQRPAAQRGR